MKAIADALVYAVSFNFLLLCPTVSDFQNIQPNICGLLSRLPIQITFRFWSTVSVTLTFRDQGEIAACQ
jgi:hypothetical protein